MKNPKLMLEELMEDFLCVIEKYLIILKIVMSLAVLSMIFFQN